MRFKMAQSEIDGLFMKANRKHEIILNFELKRIAVEKKMRERYFAFEKSLILAHHSKIVARQKALGIYRPKTTPDRKRNATNAFFITNVTMDTKAGTKLPPIQVAKRKSNASRNKEAGGSSPRKGGLNSTKKLNIHRDTSSANAKPHSWSFTEVADEAAESLPNINDLDGSEKVKPFQNNDSFDKSNTEIAIETGHALKSSKEGLEKEKEYSASDDQNQRKSSPETPKTGQKEEIENQANSSKDKNISVQAHASNNNPIDSEKTSLSTQEEIKGSDVQNGTDNNVDFVQQDSAQKTSQQITRDGFNKLPSSGDAVTKEDRPKSALSSVDGVRTELMNLNLRAQSAGVKAK